MKWNPFLSKRGRVITAAVMFFLLSTGYLASYPIAYRLLIGTDEESRKLVSRNGVWNACRELSSEEIRGLNVWQKLQPYYFPPVEWLIDHTPIYHPVIAVARYLDTDEQIENDQLDRYLQVILTTGK